MKQYMHAIGALTLLALDRFAARHGFCLLTADDRDEADREVRSSSAALNIRSMA
jgi:hypothetical protein